MRFILALVATALVVALLHDLGFWPKDKHVNDIIYGPDGKIACLVPKGMTCESYQAQIDAQEHERFVQGVTMDVIHELHDDRVCGTPVLEWTAYGDCDRLQSDSANPVAPRAP